MRKIVSLMLVLLSMNLFASERVTLDDAIKVAYDKNYDYQNVKLDQENVELQVKEGYKSAAPSLSYDGNYTLDGQDQRMSLDGSTQNFTHSFILSQPIYNGGTVISGIKIAKISQELTDYKVNKSKSSLKLSVIKSYLGVLAQKEQIKVYESSLEEVKKTYETAQRKYELNLISKADFLPLKTQLISIQTNLIEAKNQYAISMIQFKNLVGIDSEKDIALEDLKLEKYDMSLIDLDSDLNYALENNKEAQISKLSTDITKEQQNIARAGLLPQINANLSYSSSDKYLKDSADNWHWRAGVSVKWKLFDFGKSFDAYERSKNDTKKAINDEKKSREDLEVAIRTNYINLIKLNGTLETNKLSLEATKESYELQKRKYNEGIISITDYLIYETKLSEAKLGLIKTRLDYYYAYEKYNEDIK